MALLAGIPRLQVDEGGDLGTLFVLCQLLCCRVPKATGAQQAAIRGWWPSMPHQQAAHTYCARCGLLPALFLLHVPCPCCLSPQTKRRPAAALAPQSAVQAGQGRGAHWTGSSSTVVCTPNLFLNVTCLSGSFLLRCCKHRISADQACGDCCRWHRGMHWGARKPTSYKGAQTPLRSSTDSTKRFPRSEKSIPVVCSQVRCDHVPSRHTLALLLLIAVDVDPIGSRNRPLPKWSPWEPRHTPHAQHVPAPQFRTKTALDASLVGEQTGGCCP
jgi:hypothetical protein